MHETDHQRIDPLGTVPLSAQLLSPLAMASAELPGRGSRSALAEPLPEEGLPEPAGEQADGASGLRCSARPGGGLQRGLCLGGPGRRHLPRIQPGCAAGQQVRAGGGDKVFFREGTYVAGAAQGTSSTRRPRPNTASPTWASSRIPRWRRCLTGMATARPTSSVANPGWGAARGDQPSPRCLWSDPTVAQSRATTRR